MCASLRELSPCSLYRPCHHQFQISVLDTKPGLSEKGEWLEISQIRNVECNKKELVKKGSREVCLVQTGLGGKLFLGGSHLYFLWAAVPGSVNHILFFYSE